jgi:hypothetical protein
MRDMVYYGCVKQVEMRTYAYKPNRSRKDGFGKSFWWGFFIGFTCLIWLLVWLIQVIWNSQG